VTTVKREVEFKELENLEYEVISNGIKLGVLYEEVDGYYIFQSQPTVGFWPSWVMRAISDKADQLNAEWDREMETFLKEHAVPCRN